MHNQETKSYNYKLVDTKKGIKSLEVSMPEKKNPLLLHSRIDPVREADNLTESWFANTDPLSLTSIIILGMGLGYHVQAIKKKVTKECQLLVIEKDEKIFHLGQENCPSDAIVLLNPPESELENAIQKLSTGNAHLVLHRPSNELYPDYYEKMWRLIQSLVSHKDINIATLTRFDRIWLHNFMQNLPIILQSHTISDFFNEISKQKKKLQNNLGLSAALIGAGPSLIPLLPWLKEVQDSVFLVAVDTALRPLLHAGIRPDLVFTVDAQFINALYLINSPAKIPLIAEPTTHPAALRHWPGPIHFFASPFSYVQWLEKHISPLGELKHGGSVSTNAFDFLCKSGVNKIYLVGQDLSFNMHRAHAAGTVLDELRYQKNHRRLSRENQLHRQLTALPPLSFIANNGERVITNHKLHFFKQWFDKEMGNCPIPVINLAPGGLPIKNAIYSSVLPEKNESKANHFLYNYWKNISLEKKELPLQYSLHYSMTQIQEFQKEIDQILTDLPMMIELIKDGINTARSLARLAKRKKENAFKKGSSNSQIKIALNKLDWIDNEYRKFIKANELLNPVMQKVIQPILEGNAENQSTELTENPLLASAQSSQNLYEGMRDVLEFSYLTIKKGSLRLKQFISTT